MQLSRPWDCMGWSGWQTAERGTSLYMFVNVCICACRWVQIILNENVHFFPHQGQTPFRGNHPLEINAQLPFLQHTTIKSPWSYLKFHQNLVNHVKDNQLWKVDWQKMWISYTPCIKQYTQIWIPFSLCPTACQPIEFWRTCIQSKILLLRSLIGLPKSGFNNEYQIIRNKSFETHLNRPK